MNYKRIFNIILKILCRRFTASWNHGRRDKGSNAYFYICFGVSFVVVVNGSCADGT